MLWNDTTAASPQPGVLLLLLTWLSQIKYLPTLQLQSGPAPFRLLLGQPTSHNDHRNHICEELKATLHRLLAIQHLGYIAKQL